jgi:uncharacterized protein YecT (DUF1311 family)
VKALAAALCLSAAGVAAQDADCAHALTQQEMNLCAAEEYRAADKVLNDEWRLTIGWAREVGLEEDLRAAQRAWIAYRDAACAVEAAVWEGGSMAPLIHATCLTRLTRARTDDLVMLRGN